jgi:hypothetical protein
MIDFGQITDKENPEKHSSQFKRPKFFWGMAAVTALAFLTVAAIYIFVQRQNNPIPADIRKQISYKPVYPMGAIGASVKKYDYQPNDKALVFNISYAGKSINVAEEPAPSTVGSGPQVSYQALGLHPYAQIASKLGPVALVKFYKPSSLQQIGEAGVLATNGTLVIAHSPAHLTNEQWKQLFDSMKVGG